MRTSTYGFAFLTLGLMGCFGGHSKEADKPPAGHEEAELVELSAQGRKNLKMRVEKVPPSTFERCLSIPGKIQERPGGCGYVVTAPVSGIIKKIAIQRGEVVKAGEALFTLHILSEPLLTAQSNLFKAHLDLQLAQKEKERMDVSPAAFRPAEILQLDNQLRRVAATIKGLEQDLLLHGLTEKEILEAGQGKFVKETTIRAPLHVHAEPLPGKAVSAPNGPADEHRHIETFEIEEIKVLTGEHVQAGQQLAHLADHLILAVEGKLFSGEAPLVRKAAAEGLAVVVEFPADDDNQWPPLKQNLQIHYFANKIDPDSQTLGVFLLLINQHHEYQRDGKTYRQWRFRPGQTVALRLPVEKFDNVRVFPSRGVVHEAGETYVFIENGSKFQRLKVEVVHEDSDHAVVVNDSIFFPNTRFVLNAAPALNRVLKAKEEGGGEGGGHHH